MSSTKKTTQDTTSHGVTGPEQWMKDEGKSLYADAASSIPTTYQVPTNERVAGYGSTYDDAKGIITGMQGPDANLTAAGTMLDQLRSAPGNDVTKSVSDYVNPYVSGVLDPTLRKINEARADQLKSDNAAATMSGAFGDPQAGIARSLTNDRFNTQISDATNKTYSDAWNAGQAQQNTVLSRMMQMPGMQEQLANNNFNRNTALSRYLTQFGQMDQSLQQAKDNVATSDFQQQNGGYATNRIAALMQLLNGVPHDTTTDQQSHTVSAQPDNSGLQMLGKLGGTALGAVMGGPAGAFAGGSLGGSLFGGGNAMDTLPGSGIAGNAEWI